MPVVVRDGDGDYIMSGRCIPSVPSMVHVICVKVYGDEEPAKRDW